MFSFKKIDISDKDWICDLLSKSDFIGAEYSFANNMAWQRLSNSLITRYKDFYILLMPSDKCYTFTFPAGVGNYLEVINLLRKYSKANNKVCRFFGVTEKYLSLFQDNFSNEYTSTYLDDSSDYTYLASDLINLKGKKFHNKRNHLKKMDQYNWTFHKMTEKDFDECILLSTNIYNQKNNYDDHSAIVEQYAIDTFFKYFKELNLMGGIVRIDGKLAAFSIGERLNSNTVVVHIEKADTSYDGIYVLINNQFSKMFCNTPDIKYINREEDLGLDGLRNAKRSYNPIFQVDKYLIQFLD